MRGLQLVVMVGMLLIALINTRGAVGQMAPGPSFFGNSQMAPLTTTRSRSSSSLTSDVSASNSLQGSGMSSSNADKDIGSDSNGNGNGNGNGKSKRGGDKSKRGGDDSESSASDGSGDESGSSDSSSGSSSSSMEYECDCKALRRVSLMGASDYCLAPNASLSSKCGNENLGENGACPTIGAQPCSSIGHVLANDSLCLMDDKDETYKCVASKHDLDIQKNGKKKKKKSSSRRYGSGSSMSSETHQTLTARQVLGLVGCVAAAILAVA